MTKKSENFWLFSFFWRKDIHNQFPIGQQTASVNNNGLRLSLFHTISVWLSCNAGSTHSFVYHTLGLLP